MDSATSTAIIAAVDYTTVMATVAGVSTAIIGLILGIGAFYIVFRFLRSGSKG